jgi:pheromone shutdown-related protein TraB
MDGNNILLNFNGRQIRLIGTAHISRESIEEVTGAIRGEKPGMVCVELDEGRYASIIQQDTWEKLNVSKVLKEGKGFLLVANIVLTSFQRRLGSEIGVKPGEEMIAAINTAKEMGIEFSLSDREVQTTLRRAWASCGLWSKCKLLAALLSSAFFAEKLDEQEIENLKKSNELDNMMSELSSYLPAVKETLIDERDQYLATKIWDASLKAKPGEAGGTGTIAVVGAGHLPGIQKWLEKFAGDDSGGKTPVGNLAELETIPPKTLLSKCAKWIIPVLIVALIAVAFLFTDVNRVLEMIVQWVLWNGGLAALGSIIALAHPLAVLTSFVAAPFTTLSPFIGVGIFSGLVQAAVCKPRVSDAQNISTDLTSLKGLYRNRITKVLLVFFLSSLGSSIATWPALASIVGLLVK